MSLLQRQQKAFGSGLAVEVAMNATLGGRTGIHGVVQASAVRLKDVKVMNDGFHGDLLVFQSFGGAAVRANSLNLTGIGNKVFPAGATDNRRNMIFFKTDNFHGDLLNQLVSSFIKQTKNNQITNDVVSKQVHRLGQLVHATKLVGGRNIIGNGVVLFHNILLCPKTAIIGSRLQAFAIFAKFADRRLSVFGNNKGVLDLKLGTTVVTDVINTRTTTLFHNILHKRINHLESISQQHRMIRSNLC